jgi:hypothetical protein
MLNRKSSGTKSRVALELHDIPATKRMSLMIDDRVICESDFHDPNERKMILLNWEEKYSLFEKGSYCIAISY